MEIKRDKYINELILRMHNGMIKIVTGIRRCGKSYLLFKLFYSYLSHITDEGHIIRIELDLFYNRRLRKASALLDYVQKQMTDSGQYYLLIDEVQLLESFEEVLNSLLHVENLDIYVTGSNSKFLSTDVITEFRGRGDEVHLFPLSFAEFMTVYNGDIYRGYADYSMYGGLPYLFSMRTEAQKVKYLKQLFEMTYLKDIIERNKISKTEELEALVNVLASATSSLTNPSRITATFASELHLQVSVNTVRHYIECLKDAFIISEAQRYDVKGRRYIGTPLKYYFEDTGLRNARLGFRQNEGTHLMENIIYTELLRRGYSVDVGVVEHRSVKNSISQMKLLEIDFVANLGSNRYYLQSAYSISDAAKHEQETRCLKLTGDSFKKIVVVKDVVNCTRDINGITTMNIYDFLLNDNSLDA